MSLKSPWDGWFLLLKKAFLIKEWKGIQKTLQVSPILLKYPKCFSQPHAINHCFVAFCTCKMPSAIISFNHLEPELPPSKPHFAEGLEPQVTVPVDEPLSLSCKVTAHPPPQITWYRNGTPIRNEPKAQVGYRDGEATLKIPRCTKADAGMYSCLATNPHGNESSSCNVNIAGIPRIIHHLIA